MSRISQVALIWPTVEGVETAVVPLIWRALLDAGLLPRFDGSCSVDDAGLAGARYWHCALAVAQLTHRGLVSSHCHGRISFEESVCVVCIENGNSYLHMAPLTTLTTRSSLLVCSSWHRNIWKLFASSPALRANQIPRTDFVSLCASARSQYV